MKPTDFKSVFLLLGIAVLIYLFVIGCANMGGGPQGGPKDITPPKPLKSIPKNNATNYKKNKIEIIFSENIQVEKAFENVIVSPPQKQTPVVKAIGKKLIVEIKDTLEENTTYTIDFGNAIVDNNEKNSLEGYHFAFSTHDIIDSLRIAGTIIDASNLNPVSAIIVGIHSDLSDSAFLKKPFDRITKTDKQGNFCIKNIKEGKYRLYALSDIGNNFRFDIPTEQIAFLDTVFTPIFEVKEHIDTIFRDSVIQKNNKKDTIKLIDSIAKKNITFFYPDSVILKAFTEKTYRQYIVKSERKEPNYFTIYFNDKNDTIPLIEGLNCSLDNKALISINQRKDTITYWLTDSVLAKTDTLKMRITYLKEDSLKNLVQKSDTVSLVNKIKKTKNPDRIEYLNFSSNTSSAFNFFDKIDLKFSTPVSNFDLEKLILSQKVDTLWKPIRVNIQKEDSIGLRYSIEATLKYSQTYKLSIDSACFVDIYGKVNKRVLMDITTKPESAYASLTLEMGFFNGNEMIELLNAEDKVIKTIKLDKQKIKFDLLDAGTYYARLFVDMNGNGKWDTGNFADKLHPEPVYYYPYSLVLRKMWDSEEYWDYLEFPLLQQKPKELIRTKKE